VPHSRIPWPGVGVLPAGAVFGRSSGRQGLAARAKAPLTTFPSPFLGTYGEATSEWMTKQAP
jgi:hypothetical protein